MAPNLSIPYISSLALAWLAATALLAPVLVFTWLARRRTPVSMPRELMLPVEIIQIIVGYVGANNRHILIQTCNGPVGWRALPCRGVPSLRHIRENGENEWGDHEDIYVTLSTSLSYLVICWNNSFVFDGVRAFKAFRNTVPAYATNCLRYLEIRCSRAEETELSRYFTSNDYYRRFGSVVRKLIIITGDQPI